MTMAPYAAPHMPYAPAQAASPQLAALPSVPTPPALPPVPAAAKPAEPAAQVMAPAADKPAIPPDTAAAPVSPASAPATAAAAAPPNQVKPRSRPVLRSYIEDLAAALPTASAPDRDALRQRYLAWRGGPGGEDSQVLDLECICVAVLLGLGFRVRPPEERAK